MMSTGAGFAPGGQEYVVPVQIEDGVDDDEAGDAS